MQLSCAPILGYSFDSAKVAKPIRRPILPKSWSDLEQVEREKNLAGIEKLAPHDLTRKCARLLP
jgi:hypothetical protein